ncbi:uncharacterized protein DFL_004030 [Arthrobotrys flagrans]|uniref:Uncharacterized protein n=1 Tax=Arthrobotrys flagrans TaxID=97331 RepID=A0A437A3I5_ARTFL|nr:hypothetical protein DFL_004030 [Arthrobotrys flagrans]
MGPQPLQQRAALVEKYNHIVRDGFHDWRSTSCDISHKPKNEVSTAAHELHCNHRRIALNYIVREPVWHKGRLLKNEAGKYIHAFELGFTGHGTRWLDANPDEGAYQLMPIVTNMAIIIESLISKGVEKPLNELSELHAAVLPKDEEFNEQAKQSEQPRRDLTHLILYAPRERVTALMADIPEPEAQKALAEFGRDRKNYKYDSIDIQKFETMTPGFFTGAYASDQETLGWDGVEEAFRIVCLDENGSSS